MYSRIERLLIALVFALLAAGVTLVAAQAQEGNPPPKDGSLDCATCHTEFHTTWMSGPHGTAADDPAFVEAWDEQGNPGACLTCHVTGYNPDSGTWDADGVTCEACHGHWEIHNGNLETMTAATTSDACLTCHQKLAGRPENFLQIESLAQHLTDQELSEEDATGCVDCHDPHVPL